MQKKMLAGMIFLLCAFHGLISPAWAFEPFTVKDIRVEGIQRTEPGTVFSYLPVKVGDTMNDQKADDAIHALFATGFFKDVKLRVDRDVLIVQVRERPSIASIEINGTKDFPKDQLKESMKFAGLAVARIFDKGALDKATQELKREYVARGKYAVSVTTTVTELDRNRVAIVFNVVEGDVAKIKQINIIGNHAYTEAELLDLIKLGTPGLFQWFSSNDQYSKQKLSADLETLRSFYMDNGYLEFNIDSTQVSITPDKKDIYITINLTEGTKYTVSKVEISGDTIIPKSELEKLVEVKAGGTFSRKALTESTKKIGERYGQDGYAFANVNAIPDVNKEKHQVSFNLVVDPGQRVYIRHINISGNNKTRDEVIRREFRQFEAEWFDVNKVKKSKQRVDKLDFFSEVNIETPAVQGTTDQMDVNLSVKEKSTGSVSVGAGFSSGEGLVLTASVSQSNLFGSGNFLSTQVNTGRINQVYSVSYTNPYFTDDGVSRGFDVYKRNTDSQTTAVSQYSTHTLGSGVRFGVPIGEDTSINYGLAIEKTDLGLFSSSPTQLLDYVNIFGYTTNALLGTVGWGRDTRNSAIYTTEGSVQRASAEIALPALDLRYYKLTYQHQWFHPLSSDITLMLNGGLGVAAGYDGDELPFFKNFYAGGPGSVRGYEVNSLGPRDSVGAVLGGPRRALGGMEIFAPFPGTGKDQSVRLSGFVDAGAVYGPSYQPGSTGMRYSTGAAVTWISPVGPLKFSYAVPIHTQPVDHLQRFQFTLGTVF
ncbi:MAG: outer membrane protein assembly factor BamA [Gallionella sp.]